MLSAFKIKKTNLDFYQFDNRISGFEHLLYLKILRNGGMFFRDSKEIRLYDDVGENRLSITIPKKLYKSKKWLFHTVKELLERILIYNPRELIFIILKILIYNRLIEKKKFLK